MRVNIKPGVCGICGCAVVQPESPSAGWHNGHEYIRKLKANQARVTELTLVRVRCMTHKEPSDPRTYDEKGNIVDCRNIECGFRHGHF